MGHPVRPEFDEARLDATVRPPGGDPVFAQYANKTLPLKTTQTTAGLTAYSGAWTRAEAVHLLRRSSTTT